MIETSRGILMEGNYTLVWLLWLLSAATVSLTVAYNEMGFRVSPTFCQLVVSVFDRQARRCLKFDDFIQSCVMLRSLTDSFRTRDANQDGCIQVSYEDFMTMAISSKP